MNSSNYFINRRTIRQYEDRKIDRQLLISFLADASHAPTTGNMQLYSVIITEEGEAKSKLAPAHFNQSSVESAAAVLTFCADFNRFVQWCTMRDANPGYDNFQSWMWAVEDTMIFAQQFVTIAELNGFGTCYLGTTTYNAPQIAEILQLPELVVPVVTVTIGYPASTGAISDRLPIESIVHFEKYVNFDANRINSVYRDKEALPENSRFVIENKKENLAQVFTDIRYPKKDNELFSKIYVDFVKKQGFKF